MNIANTREREEVGASRVEEADQLSCCTGEYATTKRRKRGEPEKGRAARKGTQEAI